MQSRTELVRVQLIISGTTFFFLPLSFDFSTCGAFSILVKYLTSYCIL